MAPSDDGAPPAYGQSNRDDKKAHKRGKRARFSSYGLQIVGTLLIFMTWGSDGDQWSYVEVGDFKMGGRGYCDGSTCQVQYYTPIPAERLPGSNKEAPSGPAVLLILYLIEAIFATLLSGAWDGRAHTSNGPEPVEYHKYRCFLMYALCGVFALQAGLCMLWIFIEDAMFSFGFWLAALAVPAFLLAAYLEHGLYSTLWQKNWNKENPGKRPARTWKTRGARLVKRSIGFLWRSQLWSCFAAGFYIILNIIIMSHDVKRPEVQSYIDDQLGPWSNGDPRFESVEPSFFGADKSCSYFPVSSIPAQGHNRGPLVFFFVYHIGICLISFLLIVDELCDVRFGILGPQQNKTGAAWTSFYLFSATMSRSILFWSRGWVMTCNIVSWIFLGVASLNIFDYYVLSSWRGPRVKDTKRGDRHASLRTGIRPFRGPLWLPLIGRLVLKLQQAIMEGDPCISGVSKGKMTPEDEAKLEQMRAMIGDCTDECIKNMTEDGCPDHPPARLSRRERQHRPGKLRTRLNQTLGWRSRAPHFPRGGGFVGKPRGKCNPCDGGENCTRASHTLFRGFPWHRSSLTDKKANNIWIEYYLDIRRMACIVSAFLLFIVQLVSFVSELSRTARWQYRSQMKEQLASWVAVALGSGHWWNDWKTPLLLSECSHFQWSSVPVTFIAVGEDNAVRYSVTMAGFNRLFLMGMCLSIILVSYLNQRYFGQALHVITLIGPRMSSISVGLTLIHVAISTGSQSLFADNIHLYRLAKGIVYTGIIVGVLGCIVTEDFSHSKSNKKGDGISFMRSQKAIKARQKQNKRIAKKKQEEFEKRLENMV